MSKYYNNISYYFNHWTEPEKQDDDKTYEE